MLGTAVKHSLWMSASAGWVPTFKSKLCFRFKVPDKANTSRQQLMLLHSDPCTHVENLDSISGSWIEVRPASVYGHLGEWKNRQIFLCICFSLCIFLSNNKIIISIIVIIMIKLTLKRFKKWSYHQFVFNNEVEICQHNVFDNLKAYFSTSFYWLMLTYLQYKILRVGRGGKFWVYESLPL